MTPSKLLYRPLAPDTFLFHLKSFKEMTKLSCLAYQDEKEHISQFLRVFFRTLFNKPENIHRKPSCHFSFRLTTFVLFSFSLLSVCHFRRGDWSSCDPYLQLKNRTDLLKPRSRPGGFCPDQRVVTKRCKKVLKDGSRKSRENPT